MVFTSIAMKDLKLELVLQQDITNVVHALSTIKVIILFFPMSNCKNDLNTKR